MRVVIDLQGDPRILEVSAHTEAATLADLVECAYDTPPGLDAALWVDDARHEPGTLLSDVALLEGARVSDTPVETPQPLSGWTLTELGGSGPGSRCTVPAKGVVTIGRSPQADLTVDSASASWLHATVQAEGEGLRVRDRGSTNGTRVGGREIGGETSSRPGSEAGSRPGGEAGGRPGSEAGSGLDEQGELVTADTVLRVGGCAVAVRRDVAEPPAPRPGSLHNATAAGTVPFNRPPRPGRPTPPEPLSVPERKSVSPATRFSIITVVGPLVLAAAMIALMRDPRYALVSLMSPVLAVGSWLEQRRRRRAEQREADEAFDKGLAELEERRRDYLSRELGNRRAQTPAVDLVVRRALTPTTALWRRRHDDPDALMLSAGIGDVPWSLPLDRRASSTRLDPAVKELVEECVLTDAPAQVDLTGAGVVGVVGDRETALALARSLLVQACVHCGPADLTVGVFHDPGRGDAWDWVPWLPHTRRLGPGEEGRWVSGQRRTSEAMLRQLRDGVEALPTPQVLLVIDSDVLTEGRDSPARSLLGYGRSARQQSGHPVPRRVSGIVLAATVEQLPAACTAVVEVGRDSAGTLEEPGELRRVEDVVVVGLGAGDAGEAARAMARLEDPELEVPGAALPSLVRLPPLLGVEELTPEAVIRSWASPGVSTPVGVGEQGAFVLDLVRDGPHGLVGGTTGSGKSEFLRSLVAGLAARNDPSTLTFILIDFKGGAAFKTCERLPHTIGTISNLDAQMADRALRALEAEMTYRQRLFAQAGEGVDNLDAYLATSPAEPLPRLLLVVDEFAMLAKEYPDVLSSLVSVAAVGRTLGVHMILATQRPAGVVNDDILANTNMRVALRVQSREDSNNVIGVPHASAIGRQQMGRAFVKLGQDDITPVQTALSTGPVLSAQAQLPVTAVDVTDGPPGVQRRQAPASAAPVRRRASGEAETELDLLIDAVVEASQQAGYAPPRPVWPEPLGQRVDLAGFGHGPDPEPGHPPVPQVGGVEDGVIVVGLSDDPDGQRQVTAGWELEEGNLLLGGVPGSGTTTALASIALTVAAAMAPGDLDLVVLDMGANELRVLEGLPHTLAYAGTGMGARERQSRLLKFLRAELDRRRGVPGPHRTMIVLVDGLAALRDEYQDADGMPLLEALYRVYADGPDVGIHCAVTTSRVRVVPSAIDEVTTQRWMFQLADRYDYSSAGLRPHEAPPPVAGRAVVARTRLQTHVATPACGLEEAVALLARERWAGTGAKETVAGELPASVTVDELAEMVGLHDAAEPAVVEPGAVGAAGAVGAVGRAPGVSERTGLPGEPAAPGPAQPLARARVGGEPWLLPVGVAESDLAPAFLESYEGEHVLVAGPPRSGKSSTLLALAATARASASDGPPVRVYGLASRRSPLSGAGLDYLADPDEATGLVADLRMEEGPVLLLVDDAERVDDADKVLAGLLGESLPNLRVVAAGRNDDLRGLYSHWTRTLRRSRCGILLQPNVDLDGDLLSVRIPRKAPVAMTVGRGYLCLNGAASLVQVAVP